MVAPLIPYGIRGAVTYQGLENLFWAEYGDPLLATMFATGANAGGEAIFRSG